MIKKILNSDSIKNIASIGFFENYPMEAYFIKGNSAYILGTSDHLWAHIISSNKDELSSLLQKHHDKTKYFYSVEEWTLPLILQFGDEEWRMETNRYILQEKQTFPVADEVFITLSKDDASYIYSHSDYKDYTSIEYIKDRLDKGISTGIMHKGELIAWGFTHDDGALGFLHVLPAYRKQGHGEKILLSLIDKKQQRGEPIFCNIVPQNLPSINLVKKLGFDLDRKVFWLKLK